MKRSRALYFHDETNQGKLITLEALRLEYQRYLQACLSTLISHRRFSLSKAELIRFFPVEKTLSTNIVTCVQLHALEIFKSWAASRYISRIKTTIKRLFREGTLSETQRFQLFTIGKYNIDRPSENISQEALDLYWTLLLDEKVSGKTPQISSRMGMRLSIHTSTLKEVDHTRISSWWLGVSTLKKNRTVKIPLKSNPHLKSPDEVVRGCLVRRDSKGKWRVEVLEKKLIEEPKLDLSAPRVGVDVGLNVLAATSDGRLFGSKVKPKFDRFYVKVRELRANRQRQWFKENSPRLTCLEERLSGLVKTATGTVANDLVKAYPGHTFITEDLDLRGCKGQKRFAYRALHHSLSTKAPVIKVNPAYTSQMCPSCGYVSRSNRSGVRFECRGCGRISHADVVGGKNLLGRSEDRRIQLDDHPSEVRRILRERYLQRRRDSSSGSSITELAASSRRLTTKGSHSRDIGTASNAEGD